MYDFQKLDVYNKAKSLNTEVYLLIRNNRKIDRYIESQLKRASISMVINIAEGCGKSSNKDKKNFFTIARASTYECVSLLEILIDIGVVSEKGVSLILSEFDDVSKMLYSLIKSLKIR